MNRVLASGPLAWCAIILTTLLLLVLFQTILWLVLPLFVTVIAYYTLSPLVNIAMARGITRPRAVFIVTFLLCVALICIGWSLAPKVTMIVHDGPDKVKAYIRTGADLAGRAQKTVTAYFPFLRHASPPPEAHPFGTVNIAEAATPTDDWVTREINKFAADHSSDVLMELARWIPSVILIPVMTYYFLLDGPRFKRFIVQAIPNAFFEKTLYLFYRVEDQVRRYFRGLLTLTALDAICLGIGLWFLGLNAPFFLGIVAALMALLPYIGSVGGCLLVALVAANDFPGQPWLPYEVVFLFIGVRILDDFVFLPMTVGRSMHMHPLVTILMIMLGGTVAGIPGLLLVMPVLGVVTVAGQIIGELLTDERILARHRHARRLCLKRARIDLLAE